MFKYIPDDIEYHLCEIVEGNKQKVKFITPLYEEAENWYNRGNIVYEIHHTASQTDWVTTTIRTAYEWH